MAIDVLTYNALQEVNQELKAEITQLTDDIATASSGGGGGKSDGNPDGKKLECVYRSCGEREVCDIFLIYKLWH